MFPPNCLIFLFVMTSQFERISVKLIFYLAMVSLDYLIFQVIDLSCRWTVLIIDNCFDLEHLHDKVAICHADVY